MTNRSFTSPPVTDSARIRNPARASIVDGPVDKEAFSATCVNGPRSLPQIDGRHREAVMLQMQRTMGNRAVQRLVSEMNSLDSDDRVERAADQAATAAALPSTRAMPGMGSTASLKPVAIQRQPDDDDDEKTTQDDQDSSSGGFWHSVAEGASGFAYGALSGITPGGFLAPSPDPKSQTFEAARGFGQIVGGIGGAAAGAAGEVVGGAADLTGIGALVGVPLNIASAVEGASGVTSIVAGVGTLGNAMAMSSGGSGGGGPGSPYREPAPKPEGEPPAKPPGPSNIEIAQQNVSQAEDAVKQLNIEISNTSTKSPVYQDLIQQRLAAQQQLEVAKQNLKILQGGT